MSAFAINFLRLQKAKQLIEAEDTMELKIEKLSSYRFSISRISEWQTG